MSVEREQSQVRDAGGRSDAPSAFGTLGDVRTLEYLLGLMADFPSDEQRARYLLSCNWMRDTLAGVKKRADWCSCGRPARMVLEGGQHGPTGYCGVAGWPPLDPCDCGDFVRHDRSVCHIYSSGAGTTGTRLAVEHSEPAAPVARPWVVRAAWCTSSPTYYGPFPSSAEASGWAKRRLDGDIACIGYEVERLLGEADAPASILEDLSRAGLVD